MSFGKFYFINYDYTCTDTGIKLWSDNTLVLLVDQIFLIPTTDTTGGKYAVVMFDGTGAVTWKLL